MAAAIIAVLLAILLPVGSLVRRSGRLTLSSNNARTLVQVVTMYAGENRELTPVTRDGVMYPALNQDFLVGFPYWQISQTWTGVLFSMLPYDKHLSTYLSPGSPRVSMIGSNWPSSYHYSRSFAGDPRLWRPGAVADLNLQRATRMSEIRFASKKAMLWDWEASFLGGALPPITADADIMIPIPIAFADGSVRQLTPADATVPLANPLDPTVRRLDNTPDGVLGFDF